MDQYIEYFLSIFQPMEIRHKPSQEIIGKFKGRLPDQLLKYWSDIGWGGFAKGIFWLVNPEDWDEPMEIMLEHTGLLEHDAYHVIARNAFGDLWLWGEKTGGSLRIRSSDGMVFPKMPKPDFGDKGIDFEMQIYFATKEISFVDLLDGSEKPLFERAYKKLGSLEAHEVYGFVPLPALGGASELKYLQKLDAATYMDLVARNTPMRVMPDYAAIADGRA